LFEPVESRLLFAGTGTGLAATYYDNADFTGRSVARLDATVNFDWGSSSPVAGIAPDTYSVRWTGKIEPRYSETYNFRTTGNDGVRLWVNGQRLVDDWNNHPATVNAGSIKLLAGRRYDIRMDYYQNTNTALAKLEWSSASQALQVVPKSRLYPAAAAPLAPAGTGTGLRGSYFDNPDFTGRVGDRVDPTVNFDWGSAAPIAGVAPDTYSVRWEGQVEPRASETYTFVTTGNDGVRLWVNGQQLVDDWNNHPATENRGTITLEAGKRYDIRMDYYQNFNTALAELEWFSASQPRQVIPASQLYPAAAPIPTPPPAAPPAAPSGLTAAAASSTRVDLAWQDNSDNESRFDIQRSTDGTNWSAVGTVGANITRYTDTTASAQTSYRYRVAAANSVGASSPSNTATVVTPQEPATPPPPTGVAPPPVAGNWKLIWQDEFNGTSLNPVWRTTQYWDTTRTIVGQGELEAYDASAVSVNNGFLNLTARKEEKYAGAPYVSGLVQTGGVDGLSGEPTFNFRYGYMEVRAKIPKGQGIWPAIWMMPASYNDGNGELDVLEVIGNEPNVANFSLHRGGRHNTDTWTGPDFSQQFHTYGVDWQPDHVSWYVDGVERGRMTDPALICPEAMYPILNVAVGGDWPGAPDSTTKFPATMQVDYVRVWQ
jgi:beta-glucanase (GH16 family)